MFLQRSYKRNERAVRDGGMEIVLCQRKWHFSGLDRSGQPGLLTKEGLSLAAVLSSFFQSVFSYLKTLLDGFFPVEVVGRGQIVESGMKPFVVVFVDVGLDDFLGLLKSAQGLGPDAFGLKGLMEALDLPVGLGMSDPDPGMNDLLVPQVGAEFGGEILRAVVGDDARFGHALWKGLQRPLDDELDIGCRHGQAKIPEEDGPGTAVQDTDEEIMRAPEIDIRDVGVSLLMRTLGLMEALPGGFFPSGRVHLPDNPASLSTRKTVEGETATTPWSSIMKARIFSRSSGRIQCPLGTTPSGRGGLPERLVQR